MLIRDIFDLADVKGTVGIEVEVEGVRLPNIDLLTYHGVAGWKVEVDGSLKAAEAFEYVLREPVRINRVPSEINKLWGAFKACHTEVWESQKAGVHVHFNVQGFNTQQLACLITLFFVFEKPLVRYCGENREGNLFCLRADDAQDMISHIREVLKSKKFNNFNNDDYRYSSINLKSVVDYGSVEFRTMRSTPDKEAIINWVLILNDMYESVALFNDPREVIYAVSGDGYEQFMKRIFPNTHHLIPKSDTFDKDIYDGICNAQDIAFCVKWDRYKLVSNNPFVKAWGAA